MADLNVPTLREDNTLIKTGQASGRWPTAILCSFSKSERCFNDTTVTMVEVPQFSIVSSVCKDQCSHIRKDCHPRKSLGITSGSLGYHPGELWYHDLWQSFSKLKVTQTVTKGCFDDGRPELCVHFEILKYLYDHVLLAMVLGGNSFPWMSPSNSAAIVQLLQDFRSGNDF